MVFDRNKVVEEWMWGEHKLPRVCSYRLSLHIMEHGLCMLKRLSIVAGKG